MYVVDFPTATECRSLRLSAEDYAGFKFQVDVPPEL